MDSTRPLVEEATCTLSVFNNETPVAVFEVAERMSGSRGRNKRSHSELKTLEEMRHWVQKLRDGDTLGPLDQDMAFYVTLAFDAMETYILLNQ